MSPPEAMAIDLVGYATRAAGMDNVAAILAELAERMDLRKLASAASTAAVPWAQRPGCLLEFADAKDKARPLKEHC